MKKLLEIFKKPLWLLCLGLGIVLIASIFANMTNTSAYSVSVTEVSFETERGELTGLLYRPKSCTKDNPCATIVTTHGYLNSKEMQDAPAIELSKRGYVVLAMDMYDHGDSTANKDVSGFVNFYKYSQYDAVQYIYEQDYVLKAADGTGMIAVSGHSMGGFSSRMAAYLDSQDVENGEPQKIVAVLAVGADFTYFGTTYTDVIAADVAQTRTMGTIAGKYDEFFFYEGSATGSVREKDWTTTLKGTQFYYSDTTITAATNDFESGEWNTESYGGAGSVIYVPNEIHPWNHFSIESTGYMIDFYDHAFKTQLSLHSVTEDDGQVTYSTSTAQSWWLKEGFEFIGLLGMFVAIIAAISLLATTPFFNKVRTSESEINEVSKPKGARKCLMGIFAIVCVFTTTYVYPMIQLKTTTAYTDSLKGIMGACILILIAAGIASFVVKAVKGEDERASKVFGEVVVGTVAVFGASFFAYWAMTKTFFANTTFYNEPGTNVIAYWAFVSGALTLVALVLGYFLNNKKQGYTWANYGLKANWKQILIALLIAVIVVGGVYILTFAIEALLHVDFRIWTYAIKPFAWKHFLAFLRYLPAFFVFYFFNSVSIVANTGTDKTWKGTLKAIIINAIGLIILLAVHYGYDFVTSAAKYPTLALNMIYVFALVPTLIFAAWITRKSYQKTGNIWTAVFINTFLFTLMQVANTYITNLL